MGYIYLIATTGTTSAVFYLDDIVFTGAPTVAPTAAPPTGSLFYNSVNPLYLLEYE
jgi:hypothetical protein